MAAERRGLRCAIYTRKSSEEGLEQAFNSLDAQREACGAYIESQRHEGWKALGVRYDDGGYSGGSMERPALTRLLADIQARKIDVVVVYKVDRLTRALSDFAKIVEIFDAQGVSFVSVTQQFNTTSSMGRLTLNVLLSFAQFEREVTGERIRDKIAASKKKGMWMGGYMPLGYEVNERQLVVNETEAALIRDIYQRYRALGCVRLLKAELDREGIKSKSRTGRNGLPFGGGSFSRGALYTLLRNPLYVGEIRHRDLTYPGNHEAIVARELWDAVQARLEANRVDRRNGSGAVDPSLLAGLLYDAQGYRMTPSHAVKRGKRYRYYVSQSLIKHPGRQLTRTGPTRAGRIPAHELERRVCDRLALFLDNSQEVVDALAVASDDTTAQAALIARAKVQRVKLTMAAPTDLRPFLCTVVSRITISEVAIEIAVVKSALRAQLLGEQTPIPTLNHQDSTRHDVEDSLLGLNVAFALRRFSGSTHLVVPDGIHRAAAQPNVGLIRALSCARRWHEELLSGRNKSQLQLAKEMGVSARYLRKIIACAFLAPDIVEAILEGHQPRELTLARLVHRLPMDWEAQCRRLGFTAQHVDADRSCGQAPAPDAIEGSGQVLQ
jgi:DNA invertase Pin-like site-specific DNA recombinase